MAAVLLAVLVAGFVLGFLSWRASQRELEASEALTKLRAAPTGPENSIGIPAADFLKVADDYPKTGGGARALLLAGSAFFHEGKYDQAQAAFGRFLSQYPGDALAPQAVLGTAAALDAQGNATNAIVRYREFMDRFPHDAAVPQAKLALARLYAADNKPRDAAALYESLIGDANSTSFGLEASILLSKLRLQYPDLATTATNATNAPASGSAATGQ